MAEDPENAGSENEDNPSDLRAAAEAGRKAQLEMQKMKLEVAAMKAGIDVDSRIGQMYLSTYEGEADPEAIKADAEGLPGLFVEATSTGETVVTPPETDPRTTATETEQGMQQIREGLTTGAPPETGEQQVNAKDAAMEAFNAELKGQSGTRQDAAVAYFGTLLSEAAAGNPTAIFDTQVWNDRLESMDE